MGNTSDSPKCSYDELIVTTPGRLSSAWGINFYNHTIIAILAKSVIIDSMTKLSNEFLDDQLDTSIGLEGLSETNLVDVLRARHICYEAELLSLADRTKYVEGLRDANAALLATHVDLMQK